MPVKVPFSTLIDGRSPGILLLLLFSAATSPSQAAGPVVKERFVELAAQRDSAAGEPIYETDQEVVFLRSLDPAVRGACEQIRQPLPGNYAAELAAYEARVAEIQAARRAWMEQFKLLKPAYDRDWQAANEQLKRAMAAAPSAHERRRLEDEFYEMTVPELRRRHFASIGEEPQTEIPPRPQPHVGMKENPQLRSVAFTLLALKRGLDELPYRRLDPKDPNVDEYIERVPLTWGLPQSPIHAVGQKALPRHRDERLREGIVHPQEAQRLITSLVPVVEKHCREADQFTVDFGFYDLVTVSPGKPRTAEGSPLRTFGAYPNVRLVFQREQGRWQPVHQHFLQKGLDYLIPVKPGEKMDEYMARQRLFPMTKAQVILSNPANVNDSNIPNSGNRNLFWLDTPEIDYAFCYAFRLDPINPGLRSRAVQRSADYWLRYWPRTTMSAGMLLYSPDAPDGSEIPRSPSPRPSPRMTAEYAERCSDLSRKMDTARVVFMGYFSHLQFANNLESSALALLRDYSDTCWHHIERGPAKTYQSVTVHTTTDAWGVTRTDTSYGREYIVAQQYDAMYHRVKDRGVGEQRFDYGAFFNEEGCDSQAAKQLLQNFNHAIHESKRQGSIVNVKPY